MALTYMVLAVVAGAMLPLQAAMNSRLGRSLGSPVWAAALSGLVLTVSLATVAVATLQSGPRTTELHTVPWWAWAGGLCGAVVLAATASTAPRLGTAKMIALVMAGQVACSLLLDNFGLLGLAAHPVGGRRLAAALLLLAGSALML